MDIKFPKQEFNIGDKLKLNLKRLDYDGSSLRNRLLRQLIENKYKAYNIKKLTDGHKKMVKDHLYILDNSKGCIITGVKAHGSLCFEFQACSACYIDGRYSGLSMFNYDVVVFGPLPNENQMLSVQYKINDIIEDDLIK